MGMKNTVIRINPIIVNNLVPIFGTLFLNWNLPNIFIMYWVETAFFCVFLFMTKLFPKTKKTSWLIKIGNAVSIAGLSLFTLWIYGVGISIFTLTPQQIAGHLNHTSNALVTPSIQLLIPYIQSSMIGIAILAITQLSTFFNSYIYHYDKANSFIYELVNGKSFIRRIVILHLTIFIGGTVLMLSIKTTFSLVVFMVIKTIAEIKFSNTSTS